MDCRWRTWLVLALSFGAGNATMWCYSRREPGASAQQSIVEAQRALRNVDYGEAERLAQHALRSSPGSTTALLIAGEAAAKSKRLEDALRWYSRVPDTGTDVAFRALAAKADTLFQLGRLAESEATFRRTLEIEPRNEAILHRFAALLDAEGRRWDARPYLVTLVKLGRFTFQELCLVADFNYAVDLGAKIDEALEAVPSDPAPLLARARLKLQDNATAAAVEMLWKVVRARPANLEAQGLLGSALAESGAVGDFHEWRSQLPKNADSHPGVWFARGLGSERIGLLEGAIRCYGEALRIEPDHHLANHHMGLALKLLKQGDGAEAFSKRADRLADLNNQVHAVYMEGIHSPRLPRIAERLEGLGRYWEAWAWNAALVQRGSDEFVAARDRIRILLDKENPPQTLDSFNPVLQFDFSGYPLPDWSRGRIPGNTPAVQITPGSQPSFVDSTPNSGIDFTYFNGHDGASPGMRIHQTLGGGVAVLDYDGDGWPDLHFTQGARDVFREDDPNSDRMFRNLGNGRFADVTREAGVGDTGYSQGPAVGDYDNDGFPDLFISNIGKSRLYRNNGDGTFTDITAAAGINLDHWSTSALLADLNGDGCPDIYNVTYIRGKEVYQMLCGGQLARACTPLGFEGEPDHLLLSQGNGTFQDVTTAAGLAAITGKGLGILAADLERSGQLDLVVANDTEVNFFLANRTRQRGAGPLFEDCAAANGLAYNRDGLTQANMGIAADDCNGDGLLDMYITTFYKESKTLRIQQPGQMFVDMTREANLRDAGFDKLGFGTQFLDGDLDGLPDLVVANGHVDDWTPKGIPFEMRPQYFQNVGQGRFVERPAATLGAYFEARHLGRGLARLDWNRDGREDFAVSHLQASAALITNNSAGAGHYVALRLAAVNSARDAVGAVVTLTAEGFTRVRELTAGDGYFSSNQRQLVFGLGARERVDRLVVRWPSGRQQEFSDLAVDGEYLLIEDRRGSVPLRSVR